MIDSYEKGLYNQTAIEVLNTEDVHRQVTDQNQTADDAEGPKNENEIEENEAEEFELEGLMAREQGASVLRDVADGVETGSVELGREEGPVTVPEQVEVEVEYEEEEDEGELEVELEWSIVDGEAVSAEEESEEDESNETEEPVASEEESGDQE